MKQLMLYLIIINISLFPSLAFAGDNNSIFLDGKEIKLGASTNEVRSKFPKEKSYIISESPTSWLIGVNFSGDNPRFVGIINFEKGCVKSVTKRWNDYSVEAGGLKSFQALFGLLSNLTKEGYKIAQISTGTIKQPDLSADVIILTMGNRTVTISIENQPDLSDRIFVKIDEMLSN